MPLPGRVSLSVLHGVGASDMVAARTLPARPVLGSLEQVARWREAGEGRPCDVMIDTGMNRLGLHAEEATGGALRSEEHTSELQSLMRISYAVFCLKKKKPDRNAQK